MKPSENNKLEGHKLKSTSFTVSVPFDVQNSSPCNVKVMSHESPRVGTEVAYEGEDEHEENMSMKRDNSDLDLQACVVSSSGEFDLGNFDSIHTEGDIQLENKDGEDAMQSGHVSDPGTRRVEFWASPKLKRSCSNLERRVMLRKNLDKQPPSKSHSFEDLQDLSGRVEENADDPGSPGSVMSHFSADKVMLKKHSSSQILPSRSRKLWWKLFLWSHRNLHKPPTSKPPIHPVQVAALNQQGGYSSDTLEPSRAMKLRNEESPVSFSGELSKNGSNDNLCKDNQSWDGFQNGVSALWPQNQWVAFPGESSSFKRIDEWVNNLETATLDFLDHNEIVEGGTVFPPSSTPEKSPASRSPVHLIRRSNVNISEDVLHANCAIQSLNSSTSVAHIAGIGLKVIPTISHFYSLRSVNLSNNLIGMPLGRLYDLN